MSSKRYKCPYCENRLERAKLITHVDKSHQDIIPEGFSATRVVYNSVNKTNGGKCRVCGRPTEWREDTGRYDVLCKDPKCKQKMRDDYKKNMLRVRGTYNILNDPEQQTKMLANRSISGEYQFTDGSKVGYTGTYERKCLEFMDIVMQIKSDDIISPGPAMEYMYNGEKHIYIPDFYYVPYNLIIEVKDGGDNKNTKESPGMRSSRERTIEKERMITDRGVYNYIRLTDNNFQQLIEVFMEIKLALIEGDPKKTVKVNESSADSILESVFYEASKYPDEVPDEITELIKRLNSYDYGFVKKNGEKVKGMKNFFEDYRSLSISEFEKYEIGVCWDYVHYEADWFKKHGYKYETFYIQVQDEDNDCPSHTYLVFYLPGDNKPYYFESSWGKFQGIEKFDSISKLHNTIKDRHIENAESKCDPKSYFREKYNAESKSWEHLSCGDYMVKVSKGRIKLDESAHITESTKSTVNPNYKPNGKMNLSSLKMVHITESVINKYKKEYPFLKHVRCKDTKEYACDGYIWFDGDELAAMVGSCEYTDDKTKWIVSLEITKKYKGYGLSKQILDYATKTMKCKYLSVNKNNKLAKKIYDDYGFKVYQESDAMYYMTIDNNAKIKNESAIQFIVPARNCGRRAMMEAAAVKRFILDFHADGPDGLSLNGKIINWDEADEHCPIHLANIPNYMGINLCSVQSVEWSRLADGQLVDVIIKFIPEGSDVEDSAVLNGSILNESSRMTPEQLDAFYTELKKRLAENDTEESLSEMAYVNEKGEKVPKKCPKCGGDVKVFLKGVPVFLCVDCEEYFGEVPCRKKRSVKESAFGRNTEFIRHNIPIEEITDDHLKSAFDKVIHMIKWCRMDSFVFCNVKEYSSPRKVGNNSFIAGIITNDESAKEVVRVLNNNNSFSYGTFEASSRTGDKYSELFINVVELHYYETVNKPEIVSESANVDLTKFTYYHAELARKGWNPKTRAGGWDEELYSKNIDFAVHNDIECHMKDKDKVEAHLFTMGEDYSAIYLGIITVYKTSDGKIDWEWSEQEDISQAYVDYIKEEIQSTNEASTKPINKKSSTQETEIDCLAIDDEIWD